MQEAKYQIKNWKRWKVTKRLLVQTKNELMSDIKAISYTDALPGGTHRNIADKYNKLIEDVKVYDDYIQAYDIFIKRLENAIAATLNKNQRKAVIIYANHPYKGDCEKRLNEALSEGLSKSYFYDLLSESIKILNDVLDIDSDGNKSIIMGCGKIKEKNT